MNKNSAHASTHDYFPFLNGLRCLAIVWVLVHHIQMVIVNAPALSLYARFCMAGHWGVDLFFVISGFLITGLLLPKDRSEDLPNVLRFWIRRSFKIIPSCYCLLSVIFIISFLMFHNVYPMAAMARKYSLYFVFIQNLFHGRVYILDHLWSIAVEEQFYWFYPVLICLISLVNRGRFPKKQLIIVLVGIFIAVNYSRYLYCGKLTNELIQNTFFRADALSLGCLIKLLQEWLISFKFKKIFSHIFLVLALGLWGVLIFSYQFITWYFPAIAAIASASLIMACLMGNPFLIFILELGAFQFVGRISYNLYLWHYPIIFFSFYFLGRYLYLSIFAYLALTFLVGWLLTNTLEKYFLRARDRICK